MLHGSRPSLLVSISAFHTPEAQSNRTKIVTQRQLENSDLFSSRNLLHGWNDVFKEKIKEKHEKGGSTTCAISIDVDEWNQLHREFLAELQPTSKQFVSLNVLSNLRKLIFMDLLFLRGCDKYKKHQISQPNRSSPRGSVRPPNENGGRGDDDITSGPRRQGTAARRRLTPPPPATARPPATQLTKAAAPSPPPPPPPAAAAAAARASFLAFESMQKLTHALRLGQGMEHVRGNHVQVLELNCLHGVLRHVIPKGQIHVFAKVW